MNPDGIGPLGFSNKELDHAMTVINSYNSRVQNHVDYLNKRIEHLES